jgi:hypothetical protein
MRMFEGPYSDGPVSEGAISQSPLSLRIARMSGDVGPGYRILEEADVVGAYLEEITPQRCRVVRLSVATAWFIPDPDAEYTLNAPVRVRIVADDFEIGPMLAQVVSIDAKAYNGGPLVGVQLIGVSLAVGRRMLSLLHRLVKAGLAEPARSLAIMQEIIDTAERVRSLLRTLLAVGGEGVLQSSSMPVRIEQLEIEDGAEGRIHWAPSGDWGPPPYTIDMMGYNSIHRLQFDSIQWDGERAVTAVPPSIERVRHRWFRRCDVTVPTKVAFRHPLWPELQVQDRRVKDISYSGVCFETNVQDDLAFPGLEIAEIVVEREGALPIRLRGQVRFMSFGKENESALCGLSINGRSTEDERRWSDLVSQELHGTTKSGMEAPEPVWNLFESSGYFRLCGKSPDQFEPLKRSFIKLASRATATPDLICQAVWPSSRGVEASLSLLKAYYGAWMIHQIAKRPGRAPGDTDPRLILRDVYVRALEHPQVDPDFRWVISNMDASVAWTKVAHADFADRHEATGLASVGRFVLMEGSCLDRTSTWDNGNVTVGEATYEELEQLSYFLSKTRPRSYIEALDFLPDYADLRMISKRWTDAGLERSRNIFVARSGFRLLAAAVVETGETGTNLFRLMDSIRVFSLGPRGGEAYGKLFDASREWLLSKGKTSFVYFHEREDEPHIAGAKLRRLGEGFLWIISAFLVPEFLEHIYSLTTPVTRRKR